MKNWLWMAERMMGLVLFAHHAIALHDNPRDDDLVHEVEHASVHPESRFLSFLARLWLREGYTGHLNASGERWREGRYHSAELGGGG